MKHRIAHRLLTIAIRLSPEMALAIHLNIREQTIQELAAQHHQQAAARAARQ